jgi:zinc transport system permease protein
MDIKEGLNMLEIFHYSFMIRAFLAGTMIAIIAPLIGTFLVAKRYSLMADSLAHVSLAGVALGLLFGINPIYTAIAVATLTAITIEKLRTTRGISGEVALAMFLSGGLAIAIVLIGLGKGFSVDLFSYLFGSITTVQSSDLWVIGFLGCVVLLTVCLLYKEFVSLSFDEEAAQVSGIPVTFLNLLLMILTALTVSIGMRVVGVLLIGALMVIPVVTAMQLRQSFKNTILFSILFSFLSVVSGLFLSYYLNLASGGTIVVFSLILFLFITLFYRSK